MANAHLLNAVTLRHRSHFVVLMRAMLFSFFIFAGAAAPAKPSKTVAAANAAIEKSDRIVKQAEEDWRKSVLSTRRRLVEELGRFRLTAVRNQEDTQDIDAAILGVQKEIEAIEAAQSVLSMMVADRQRLLPVAGDAAMATVRDAAKPGMKKEEVEANLKAVAAQYNKEWSDAFRKEKWGAYQVREFTATLVSATEDSETIAYQYPNRYSPAAVTVYYRNGVAKSISSLNVTRP